MTDLKSLDQLNNSPLSKAVRPLLNDPDSGNLHLKQFVIEMAQDALSRHQTRYWTYLLRRVLTIMEDPNNENPRQTYNLLINNPNLEQTDELPQRQGQMLQQAKKQEADLLFENLLDNLTSNLNLEPEYPELL